MISPWLVVLASFAYLGLLFAVASWGDRRADAGRSLLASPYVYTLSLSVYCTAWTYYGSVELAAQNGLQFLPTYLGPTLAAFAFPFVLLKMLRITKAYGITSIADFIAARYGKSALLGGIVTIVAAVGVIPYISLQLKALAGSVTVMMGDDIAGLDGGIVSSVFGIDTALAITLLLATFTIFFGTRHIDATETHQGMVVAIAFESIVKLLAFLVVGIAAVWVLNDGLRDLIGRTVEAGFAGRLSMAGSGIGYLDWFVMTLLAGSMVFVLPRQFQVAVLENVDEGHIRTATWLFPAYLLAINLFVLPIAAAGLLAAGPDAAAGQMIILQLPLASGHEWLALATYVGGLSAATAMIIVAAVALSTMISNDLVIPVLLRLRAFRMAERGDLVGIILYIRRAAILGLLLLGYVYFKQVANRFGLVTIGQVSFVALVQLVPAILGGIYWRDGTRSGAVLGILGGFAIWFYTLAAPALAQAGALDDAFLTHGAFGIPLLRPQALFGIDGLHPITHATIWSLACNTLLYVGASLAGSQGNLERLQALSFVEVEERRETTRVWRGDATVADLCRLMERFVAGGGVERTLALDARRRGRRLQPGDPVDADFVQLAERQLARVIGAASARVMVSLEVRGEVVGPEQVMEILDETSQVIEYSQRLEQKSHALERATAELREANTRLQELDRLKDDFIATVSHELRTPLTSIRSFSEILLDSPELEAEQRAHFLEIVVRESERLTRLINDVLDLSKI
ncbi:MAG: histidine kinase, partial [Geminicoccaceae bacterium]|nr:histidine kinase [Geminicoccaceae bacterium]